MYIEIWNWLYSSLDEHLGWVRVVVFMNTVWVNIGTRVFLSCADLYFFRYIPRSRADEFYNNSASNFPNNLSMALHSNWSSIDPISSEQGILRPQPPLPGQPHQHFGVFSMTAVLTGMKFSEHFHYALTMPSRRVEKAKKAFSNIHCPCSVRLLVSWWDISQCWDFLVYSR